MKKVKVAILAGFGINADNELAYAFSLAGGTPEFVHLEELRTGTVTLDAFDILAFPGGFSFGDHLGSGKVLSHIVKTSIKPQIEALKARGGLILGICNGFQTLVKMGLLPDTTGTWQQEVSLIHNSCGHFLDMWVDLTILQDNKSPWLKGIDSMYIPMRHGEGQLVVRDAEIAKKLEGGSYLALRYTHGAPNGSWLDVAGMTDDSGQILGLMPHPECYLEIEQRPDGRVHEKMPSGLALFFNAIAYCKAREV